MTDVSVRQAVYADLEVLAALFDRYRQFQGQPSDPTSARRFLHARFEHGESVLFLAHRDRRPVGFAQLYPSFSSVSLLRVFQLNDLFVDEDGRREGIASRLLAALEDYASSMGAVRITLAVAISNERAQALYEASGWNKDQQFLVYHRFLPSHIS